MIIKKLILGTLMAGCLSIGTSFADDVKPTGPTADQKAKLDELKTKLEAKRADWAAHHDSLSAEHKGEIEKRIAEHKADMDKRKDEMDAVKDKVTAVIEACKDKMKGANDSTKAALAKELGDKLKEIHAAAEADHKGKFEDEKGLHEADLDKKKDEIEQHIKDCKADFDAHQKEIEAKRAEWLKGKVDGDKPVLTPEQEAAMKAKFEEWLKAHANAGTKP